MIARKIVKTISKVVEHQIEKKVKEALVKLFLREI